MKIIISSAKTMNESKEEIKSLPLLIEKTKKLLKEMKKLSLDELSLIWDMSKEKTDEYLKELDSIDLYNNLTKAINAYSGVVYRQFADVRNDEYINKHLLILSAFYGVLRPADGIRKYRLEMASKMKVEGENLYQFWSKDIYDSINDKLIINLASEEYARCIRSNLKEDDVFIDMDFIEMIDGKEKRISSNMKKARGQMLRYMIVNEVEDTETLKSFNWNGYRYDSSSSKTNKLVFRKEG